MGSLKVGNLTSSATISFSRSLDMELFTKAEDVNWIHMAEDRVQQGFL
jgi:hypothetical protein